MNFQSSEVFVWTPHMQLADFTEIPFTKLQAFAPYRYLVREKKNKTKHSNYHLYRTFIQEQHTL